MEQLNSPASVHSGTGCKPVRSGFASPTLWALVGFTVLSVYMPAQAADDATRAKSQQLLVAAADADIKGDSASRFKLLHEAASVDPENQLAHWQLGEVKVDGKWVSIEESQRRAAADPKQSEYARLLTVVGEDPQDQFDLARWCRKNSLVDESIFHWVNVLKADPTNEEALRSLDVRWIDGQLLNRKQLAQLKEQIQAAKGAAKRWEPTISKWRRAVAGRDDEPRNAALAEIRAISSVDSIPSIEAVTLGKEANGPKHADACAQIAAAFVDALDKLPAQAATESLVRHAVLQRSEAVRASAAAKLKPRPQSDYIPLLLGGLTMPIESSFSIYTDSEGNVHYTHTLYREGPDVDKAVDASYATIQSVLPGHDYVYRRRFNILEDRTQMAVESSEKHSRRGYGNMAKAVESQVQRANQVSEQYSSRILPVLATVTNQQFASPKDWWNWWREHNEYYSSERPVDYQHYSGTDRRYFGNLEDTYVEMSCFTKGTLVWTKTGNRPIETLVVGDLVLSQDVNTGELAYKALIGRTVRPPSPTLKVSVAGDQITATKGHPFWVCGTGWKMAKELAENDVLQGVAGAAKIQSIAATGDNEAYNLVVADFATYFVGETGFLVHDNTARKPTRVVVPGIAAK